MPKKITVTFSEAQARALNCVLAYAERGDPQDAGLSSAAEQRAARNACTVLQSAMAGECVALVEPEPGPGPALAYGSPAVEADSANHDLRIWWRKPLGHEPSVEARIPVEDVPHFVRQVGNQAMIAIEGAVQAIGYGDCETCKNARLVHVESHGRMTSVECPDCRKNGKPRTTTTSVLRSAPTIGPKVKPEVQDWVL